MVEHFSRASTRRITLYHVHALHLPAMFYDCRISRHFCASLALRVSAKFRRRATTASIISPAHDARLVYLFFAPATPPGAIPFTILAPEVISASLSPISLSLPRHMCGAFEVFLGSAEPASSLPAGFFDEPHAIFCFTPFTPRSF